MAQRAKQPQHVAVAVRGLEFDFNTLCQFFIAALNASPSIDVVVSSILAEGAARFSAHWTDFVREMLITEKIAPERVARLLTSLDDTFSTWNYVQEYGREVNDAYWRVKRSYFVRSEVDELLFGVRRYAEYGRPLTALDASTQRLGELPTSLLVQLLDGAVHDVNKSAAATGNLSVYNIERAFDELRKRKDVAAEEVAALEFRYLPIFRARRQTLTLHTLLVQRPQMFMDAICAVFKPANREPEPVSEGAEKLAVAAYELLTGLQVLPGQNGNEVDYASLLRWCQEVRHIAVEADRVEITDQRIGALLAHAPASQADGAWPHEAVRAIIEQLASKQVELGLAIERFNMRGVYSKAIGDGGQQERALAKQSQDWAAAMPYSPRTAAMLQRIAESWLCEAEREDQAALKDELRR